RRVSPFQRLHLPIFHDELENDVGKLRRPELQTLHWNELLRWATRKRQRQPGARPVKHFEFHLAWRQVRSSQFLQELRLQRRGLAREHREIGRASCRESVD